MSIVLVVAMFGSSSFASGDKGEGGGGGSLHRRLKQMRASFSKRWLVSERAYVAQLCKIYVNHHHQHHSRRRRRRRRLRALWKTSASHRDAKSRLRYSMRTSLAYKLGFPSW
jgi:hypothetical protein